MNFYITAWLYGVRTVQSLVLAESSYRLYMLRIYKPIAKFTGNALDSELVDKLPSNDIIS